VHAGNGVFIAPLRAVPWTEESSGPLGTASRMRGCGAATAAMHTLRRAASLVAGHQPTKDADEMVPTDPS
jgi:hypothetical protein